MSEEQAEITLSKYENSYVWLAKSRQMFLKENITKDVASDMTALLFYYDSISSDPITVYIHCRGGDLDGLVQIYDVMNLIQSPIRTVCIGRAYSAGAVLLAAGEQGMRYAMKSSKVMIHGVQGFFPPPGSDQVASKNYFTFLKSHNDTVMKILAKHTGKELNQVKKDCVRDTYMSAAQAVKYGIVDHIV